MKRKPLINIIPLVFFIIIRPSINYAQTQTVDSALTKKELHQQKRLERKHHKDQLILKADSIKISAMLQLRNSPEAEQIDSLKRVMKNSKQLAKEAILKSEEVKRVTKELGPYLDHYKQYKSKLALLDSGNNDALLNEGKSAGLKELSKNEEYKDLTNDLQSYTKHLNKTNPLDSANRQALLQDAKALGLQELSKKEEFKTVKKELSPYLDLTFDNGSSNLKLKVEGITYN